jgi:hypothetical protein
MANMSQEQVESFIREKRDKSNKNWDEIAKDLAKAGYVSPRTGKPVVGNTVRYIYYYGFKTQHGPSAAQGGSKVTMIREILKLKTDDKNKLSLITQILDND